MGKPHGCHALQKAQCKGQVLKLGYKRSHGCHHCLPSVSIYFRSLPLVVIRYHSLPFIAVRFRSFPVIAVVCYNEVKLKEAAWIITR